MAQDETQNDTQQTNTDEPRFRTYVINLDRSTDRWARICQSFASVPECQVIRISAVDVQSQPEYARRPHYAGFGFLWRMGRKARPQEIGCYASHLRAIRDFLDSGEPWAMICEDDVVPTAQLPEILRWLTEHSDEWELVRLARCREKDFHPLQKLPTGNTLGINIGGFSYAPAYLLNRQGAERLLRRVSCMKLPFDLALYHGWRGVREFSLLPPALTMNELSDESTLGRKKHAWYDVFFIPSKLFCKIWMRIVRGTFQRIRIHQWRS